MENKKLVGYYYTRSGFRINCYRVGDPNKFLQYYYLHVTMTREGGKKPMPGCEEHWTLSVNPEPYYSEFNKTIEFHDV